MTQSTTRRAVLAGAVTLPAIALPATINAASTDPVFAAIDRFKAAYEFHGRRIEEADEIRGAVYARVREAKETIEADRAQAIAGMRRLLPPEMTDEQCVQLMLDVVREDAEKELGEDRAAQLSGEGADAQAAAQDELFATAPTTAVGACALIEFVLNGFQPPHDDVPYTFDEADQAAVLETLAKYVITAAA